MNKKLVYIFVPVLFLVLLYIFWPESEEGRKIRELKEQAKHAALMANPTSGEHRQFVEQNKKLFTEENMYSFAQLMEMARTGRLSLLAELWKMRSKCGENINYDECNIRIENFLREQYPAPDNEKIIALFRNYLRYEDAMRRFKLPESTSIAERLELIKKKRREFFSEADAQLIFGYEETRTATDDALAEFVKSSANMPASERVKKYYELRKQSMGDYNAALNESEPQYTRYETEIMLRNDEMQRQNNSAATTQALREKYFGAEGAKRMAQVDKEIKEERARIDNYEAAAQKFLRESSGLSEAEKKAKLAELRTGIMGKEEADAYDRRMQYEEYLKANNLK